MGYFNLLGIRTLSVGKFTVDFSTVNENVLELSRETINLSLRNCRNRIDSKDQRNLFNIIYYRMVPL